MSGTSYHGEHESPVKSKTQRKFIKSMCNNFPNIRITEGNNFSIILPLLSRTYVATKPIDEEIDPEQLENVVVTFGGVQYPAQRTARGVQIDLPATLAVGTYNILLTAEYLGSNIRAAYESAVTIVPWSAQSTAEQYITGSPIVLRAAYVLSGALTDAELEELKEEYREKNAQLQQAIEDAEAAKAEWEQKAADLDGVAQESTSQDILTAVENIDTSDLAKEDTAQQILQKVSVGADALEVEVQDGKAAIVDAIEDKGGTASTAMSLTALAQAIDTIQVPTLLRLNAITFENSANQPIIDMGGIDVLNATSISFNGWTTLVEVRNFPRTPLLTSLANLFNHNSSLKRVTFGNKIDTSHVTAMNNLFGACPLIEEVDLSMFDYSSVTSVSYMFSGCYALKRVIIPNFKFAGDIYNFFSEDNQLEYIDAKNSDASTLTTFGFSLAPTTLIGDTTYEEVVAGNIVVFNGLKISLNISIMSQLNRASLRAFLNGLADRTGQSTLTLTIGATNIAKLSADDIAVATNKNWTLA